MVLNLPYTGSAAQKPKAGYKTHEVFWTLLIPRLILGCEQIRGKPLERVSPTLGFRQEGFFLRRILYTDNKNTTTKDQTFTGRLDPKIAREVTYTEDLLLTY